MRILFRNQDLLSLGVRWLFSGSDGEHYLIMSGSAEYHGRFERQAQKVASEWSNKVGSTNKDQPLPERQPLNHKFETM